MSKISVVKASGEHLVSVGRALWDVSANELALNGINPDDLPFVFNHAGEHAIACMDENGSLLCVCGANEGIATPGVWWTWFVGGKGFPERWKEVTMIVRNVLIDGISKENPKQVRARSAGKDARARRWFATLGFRPDEPYCGNADDMIQEYVFCKEE